MFRVQCGVLRNLFNIFQAKRFRKRAIRREGRLKTSEIGTECQNKRNFIGVRHTQEAIFLRRDTAAVRVSFQPHLEIDATGAAKTFRPLRRGISKGNAR